MVHIIWIINLFSMFFYDHFQNELGTKTLDDFATAVLYYINKFQERLSGILGHIILLVLLKQIPLKMRLT